MNQVVVHPERCVGCMQCMLACATAHSRSGTLWAATLERPQPKPRIHVGAGCFNEGFPNRCRHCDPAPCQAACLAGAIHRIGNTGTVMIHPDRCINCASCAMACPYGVIRFHEDPFGPPNRPIAVKCDNCSARVVKGQIPACVEVCKAGALTWETIDHAMRRKNSEVSKAMSSGMVGQPTASPGVALLQAIKKAELELSGR